MRAAAGRREGAARPPAARLADLLALAATPVFLGMAVGLQAEDAGPLAELCSAGGFSPLRMDFMYLLMSLFHAGPWLRRLACAP